LDSTATKQPTSDIAQHVESEEKNPVGADKLAKELEGEIKNPLKGISREQLFEDVERFQRERGLPEDILPVLRRGALVAQNPAGFEHIEDLPEEEKQALRNEVTHRWRHPRPLYYTIFLNSVAAAIQGWDQVPNQSAPFFLCLVAGSPSPSPSLFQEEKTLL
jgi:hypothetical protein